MVEGLPPRPLVPPLEMVGSILPFTLSMHSPPLSACLLFLTQDVNSNVALRYFSCSRWEVKSIATCGRLGALSYFAGAEKKDERVLVPGLGSLTSIYDRHYPEWDEDHPIHFVGHLAGAQVFRVLQQMLVDKAFNGYENTSENWVLSIAALSGAFNGTTRTYFDGMPSRTIYLCDYWFACQLFNLCSCDALLRSKGHLEGNGARIERKDKNELKETISTLSVQPPQLK